jgi:hypothetical protein
VKSRTLVTSVVAAIAGTALALLLDLQMQHTIHEREEMIAARQHELRLRAQIDSEVTEYARRKEALQNQLETINHFTSSRAEAGGRLLIAQRFAAAPDVERIVIDDVIDATFATPEAAAAALPSLADTGAVAEGSHLVIKAPHE